MLRAMQRVYLLYAREHQDQLLVDLQQLGVLHLEQTDLTHVHPGMSQTTADLAELQRQLENLLVKTRGIVDIFREVDTSAVQTPSARREQPDWGPSAQSRRETELEQLEKTVRELVSERGELQDRWASGQRLAEIIQATRAIRPAIHPDGRAVVAAIAERADAAELNSIVETLERFIPGQHTSGWRELSAERTLVLIGVDHLYTNAVRGYLTEKGMRPVSLPAHVQGLDYLAAVQHLVQEQQTLPIRLREIDEELRGRARDHGQRVTGLARELANRAAQLEAARRCGYTQYTFLASGWVPKDDYPRLRQTLAQRFPGIIVQADPTPAAHEEIPVAFHNNPWAQPYQAFMSILGFPKYGTIDPVPYISLFFPLFFGIMVGDIGYGLVFLSLVLWAKRKFAARSELLAQALTVGIHAGVSSMLFGLVFAEFFGLIVYKPIFHRGPETTTPFLLFTLAIGSVQIVLGFVLGVVNALREHQGKHALARATTLVILLALGLVVGVLTGALPPGAKTPGLIALMAAAPFLIYSGGLIGVLEVFGAVTNIFSYARLMGFALAGVMLAEQINHLAGAMGPIVVGALVALVLHVPNFVIHLFASTIQSARLHYVEFFQKFIELGGKPYEPFCERRPL